VDDSKSDIVMMFVDSSGTAVLAESTLDVLKGDPFMAAGWTGGKPVPAFEAITDYNDYSNFFEVTSFNFNIKLNPRDDSQSKLSGASKSSGAHVVSDQFSRWRSASNEDVKDIPLPVDFDNFTFTRVIDGASPRFFDACCNQVSFQSAVLVKRVAVGGGLGTAVVQRSVGFLRFDFRDVMLTSVDWDDGDLVTESCTFICKAMRVRYRQQRASGRFDDESASGSGKPAGQARAGGLEANWDQKDRLSNDTRGA
jgi:type VI protein secretion system component Hcp